MLMHLLLLMKESRMPARPPGAPPLPPVSEPPSVGGIDARRHRIGLYQAAHLLGLRRLTAARMGTPAPALTLA